MGDGCKGERQNSMRAEVEAALEAIKEIGREGSGVVYTDSAVVITGVEKCKEGKGKRWWWKGRGKVKGKGGKGKEEERGREQGGKRKAEGRDGRGEAKKKR